MAIYHKTTNELIEEFLKIFVPPQSKGFKIIERKTLADGGSFKRKEILKWFADNYPKIKPATVNAHLIKMSTNAYSRIHHNLRPNGKDDLLYQTSRSSFRLYQEDVDPTPICKQTEDDGTLEEMEFIDDEQDEIHEFAYERDLKNFLVKNLHLISANLTLYEDGDIRGVEYPVDGRFIDILAVDNQKDLVVIELKVSKGYDRVVGQLLRYMASIKNNLAEPSQKVRGMIVARKVTKDLLLATSLVNDVELFEYEMAITLKKKEL